MQHCLHLAIKQKCPVQDELLTPNVLMPDEDIASQRGVVAAGKLWLVTGYSQATLC